MTKATWSGGPIIDKMWGDEHKWIREICKEHGLRSLKSPSWERRGLETPDDTTIGNDDWAEVWGLEKENLVDPIEIGAEFYLLEFILSGAIFSFADKEIPREIAQNCGVTQTKAVLRGYMGELETKAVPVLASYTDMIIGGELRHCKPTHLHEGRQQTWSYWKILRDSLGPDLLLDAQLHFVDWSAGSAYCGPPWATIAQTYHTFLSGVSPPHMFIDRCMNLEHNGGNFLNKISWPTNNRCEWGYQQTKILGEAHNNALWVLMAMVSDDFYDAVLSYLHQIQTAFYVSRQFLGHIEARTVQPSSVDQLFVPAEVWQKGYLPGYEEMTFEWDTVIREPKVLDKIMAWRKENGVGQPKAYNAVKKSPSSYKDASSLVAKDFDNTVAGHAITWMANHINPWVEWGSAKTLLAIGSTFLMNSIDKGSFSFTFDVTAMPALKEYFIRADSCALWQGHHNFPVKNLTPNTGWNLGITADSKMPFRFPPDHGLIPPPEDGNKLEIFSPTGGYIKPSALVKVGGKGSAHGWYSNPDTKWSITQAVWDTATDTDRIILNNVALFTDRWWKRANTSAGVTYTLVEWEKLSALAKDEYVSAGHDTFSTPSIQHFFGDGPLAYGTNPHYFHSQFPNPLADQVVKAGYLHHFYAASPYAGAAVEVPVPVVLQQDSLIPDTHFWLGEKKKQIHPINRYASPGLKTVPVEIIDDPIIPKKKIGIETAEDLGEKLWTFFGDQATKVKDNNDDLADVAEVQLELKFPISGAELFDKLGGDNNAKPTEM